MTSLRLALDRAASSRNYDTAGRLHVRDSVITAAQVNEYLGSEINDWQRLGLDPDRRYKLLRDPEELSRAVHTFNGLPVLARHQPSTASDHPRDVTIGATGNDATFDGTELRNSLVIWPAYAIDLIESGEQRDLSCGYEFTADMTPGVYRGERYDGVMRNLIGNHVALVAAGRVEGAMIGDAAPHLGFDSTNNAFFRRRLPMRFERLRHVLFLAADSAAREHRRARDEEEEIPPTDEELSEAPADADSCLAIVKTMLADLPRDEAERLLEGLGKLADTGSPEMAANSEHIGGELLSEDRGRRGTHRFARRASGAGDRHRVDDRHRHRMTGDNALPRGVLPASERFANVGRNTVLGGGRNDGLSA